MLGHWHGQERRIGDAASRRFLGVVGQGHAQVSATVILQSAQQPQLSLVVCNARHDVGVRDVSELAIGGVDAVAAASPLPDDLLLPACVAGRAAASQVVSFIHDITPAQLVAVGFVEPVLHDHALTGQVLALPRGAGQLRLRLLQVFALDHINATEPDQMLVQQADDAVHNDVPIYLPLLDVMQRFDEARLAELRDPRTGGILTVTYVRSMLRTCMAAIGRDASVYGAHSLRIGGATALAFLGVPGDQIQAAGRWHSGAYLSYLRQTRGSALRNLTLVASADTDDMESDFVAIDAHAFDEDDEP